MRSKGHKLKTQWNGRRGDDAQTTGTCECRKWKKSGPSQEAVRALYRTHVADEKRKTSKGR